MTQMYGAAGERGRAKGGGEGLVGVRICRAYVRPRGVGVGEGVRAVGDSAPVGVTIL